MLLFAILVSRENVVAVALVLFVANFSCYFATSNYSSFVRLENNKNFACCCCCFSLVVQIDRHFLCLLGVAFGVVVVVDVVLVCLKLFAGCLPFFCFVVHFQRWNTKFAAARRNATTTTTMKFPSGGHLSLDTCRVACRALLSC